MNKVMACNSIYRSRSGAFLLTGCSCQHEFRARRAAEECAEGLPEATEEAAKKGSKGAKEDGEEMEEASPYSNCGQARQASAGFA